MEKEIQYMPVGRVRRRRRTWRRTMRDLVRMLGLVARDWLVLWESGSQMCLVHRGNGKTRRIEI